jgi:UDP-glucose 4-epimerase
MKVVITGGCGFLGTNLMDYLQRTEPETQITLIDLAPPVAAMGPNTKYVFADTRNLASILPHFAGVDEVYHLAGLLGTSELLGCVSLASEVNILGCTNVLDAAKACGVKRVYNVAKPQFESFSENTYTLTKNSAELMGKMYQKVWGMEVATVRWLNAMGPYQHLYPIRKFLPMMILLALYDLPLEVFGSGNQTMDPIDVEDVSRFTVYACRHMGKDKEVFDLGSGQPITCNAACELILDAVNTALTNCWGVTTSSTVIHLPMREGEAEEIQLHAKMEHWAELGMFPEVPFTQSIANTVDYIMGLPEYHRQNALAFYGKTAPPLSLLVTSKWRVQDAVPAGGTHETDD